MVTHYPKPVASFDDVAIDVHPEPDGIVTRTMHRMRQAFCGLHGHDNLMQFEKDRLFLQCVSCGHESPGWTLADEAPVPRLRESEARVHAVMQPHLMRARRIA